MEKICTRCKILKNLGEYSSKGKYLSSMCKKCDSIRSEEYRKKHGRKNGCPHKAKLRHLRNKEKNRKDRATNNRLAEFILSDCRKSDKKKNRDCDLDLEFVRKMIDLPCEYCGATKTTSKMTLDRINNSLGHLKNNVVICCYRCNLMKSDMPNEAWMLIAPAIKEAYLSGAFGDWKKWPKRFREIENTEEEINEVTSSIPFDPTSTVVGGKVQKATDEEMLKALKMSSSICQALTSLGMAPKGGNYIRAKRLLGIDPDKKMPTSNNNLKDFT